MVKLVEGSLTSGEEGGIKRGYNNINTTCKSTRVKKIIVGILKENYTKHTHTSPVHIYIYIST
jgi:hypothetical protein